MSSTADPRGMSQRVWSIVRVLANKVLLFAACPRLTQQVILRGIYIPYSHRRTFEWTSARIDILGTPYIKTISSSLNDNTAVGHIDFFIQADWRSQALCRHCSLNRVDNNANETTGRRFGGSRPTIRSPPTPLLNAPALPLLPAGPAGRTEL